MNDGSAAGAAFAKIFHHPRHVRVVKRLDQILREPRKRLVLQRRAGDLLEKSAQERIGSRMSLRFSRVKLLPPLAARALNRP